MATSLLGNVANTVKQKVREMGEFIVLIVMLIGYWLVVQRGAILAGVLTSLMITQVQNTISVARMQDELMQIKAQVVQLANLPAH